MSQNQSKIAGNYEILLLNNETKWLKLMANETTISVAGVVAK